MWHAQALEASTRFLPCECPLVSHVITNYMKHHSPALTTIPEDEPLEEDLKIVRPLNEVKNDNINYHQIIRDHVKKPAYQEKPPAVEIPEPVFAQAVAEPSENADILNSSKSISITDSLIESQKVVKQNSYKQMPDKPKFKLKQSKMNTQTLAQL